LITFYELEQIIVNVNLSPPRPLRVKICGITQLAQGCAIAQLGATSLGFICVPSSPRYIAPASIAQICGQLPARVARIGVVANLPREEIAALVRETGLSGIQLHGQESPEFCQQLRQAIPQVEIIKALRIRSIEDMTQAQDYVAQVDALLLDAYDPQQLGGTGKTIDWQMLQQFRPACPWLLAGGLSPENILTALAQVQPDGIDLSSGVEHRPGDKDLARVAQLFKQLEVGGYLPTSGVASASYNSLIAPNP
jgi:phosphoribosylanthranilate isomerase